MRAKINASYTFECEKDLSEYCHSMLFDKGTEVARLVVPQDGAPDIVISLRVCGEGQVVYDATVDGDNVFYKKPSDFPEDVVRHYRFPAWDRYYMDFAVEEVSRNWFACCLGAEDSDDFVVEEAIHKMTPEEVEAIMWEAYEYFTEEE